MSNIPATGNKVPKIISMDACDPQDGGNVFRILTHRLKFIFSDFSTSHAKANKGASPCPSRSPPRPPGPLAFPYRHVATQGPEDWMNTGQVVLMSGFH